jgi:hypothetical protein
MAVASVRGSVAATLSDARPDGKSTGAIYPRDETHRRRAQATGVNHERRQLARETLLHGSAVVAGWRLTAKEYIFAWANERLPDLGAVSRIDVEGGEIAVDSENREVIYGFDEFDELVLAYATTIHKSQGSEYPTVVIPLTTQHYPMLRRNLVYTGVTRGKRLVALVGQRKAIAVKGDRARRRWSKLREWLIGCDCHSVAAGSDEPNRGFSRKRGSEPEVG